MKSRIARVLLVVLFFTVLAVGYSGCGNSYSPTAPDATPAPGAPPPTPRY